MQEDDEQFEGGCPCRQIRYRLKTGPMFVHGCHCTWCQRETGSAFAINALIESSRVELLQGTPEVVDTPSQSSKGQKIVRCPSCRVAVWSHYAGAGEAISFIRVGTLDQPGRLEPDIHIFTESKLPWIVLPEGAPAVPVFYRWADYWPPESLERRQAALAERS